MVPDGHTRCRSHGAWRWLCSLAMLMGPPHPHDSVVLISVSADSVVVVRLWCFKHPTASWRRVDSPNTYRTIIRPCWCWWRLFVSPLCSFSFYNCIVMMHPLPDYNSATTTMMIMITSAHRRQSLRNDTTDRLAFTCTHPEIPTRTCRTAVNHDPIILNSGFYP